MHELLDTLTNPIFWQGVAAASLVALIAIVMLLTLISGANTELPLATDRRHGDRHAWPGRATPSETLDPRRAGVDTFRGGRR